MDKERVTLPSGETPQEILGPWRSWCWVSWGRSEGLAANRPLVPSNLLSVAVAAGTCLRLGLDRAASPCAAPSPAAASYSPAGNTPKHTGWGFQYPHSQAKALLANQIHQPSPHRLIYTHIGLHMNSPQPSPTRIYA